MSRSLPTQALPAGLAILRELPRSGRVRVGAPGLRGDPDRVRAAADVLRRLPGVVGVDGDPRTGRLLVVVRGDEPLPLPRAAPAPPTTRPRGRIGRLKALLRPGAAPPSRPWHALAVDEVLAALDADPSGLDGAEADARRARYGENALEPARVRSRLALAAAQLCNVQGALLTLAWLVSAAIGEWADAGAVFVVLALDTLIGYQVERNSERLLASWRVAEAGEASVLRRRRVHRISTIDLVPGDLLLLRGGDVVPADARVIEAHRLACDEAPLTGESEPQVKRPAAVAEEAPLADRSSMVFAGTNVVAGHGRAVVVATGLHTELARVRKLIEESAAPETPLARRLAQLGRRVAAAAVGGAGLHALAGLVHGRRPGELVRGAVALGLAALPEGLPVVSTAALVRSMARMRRDGMVVRRLASAETLGGVTVICTDKTGTLTLNDMRLEQIDSGDGPRPIAGVRARPERLFEDAPTLLLAAALLNSDVDVHRRGREILGISGSSTERALVLAAYDAGLDGTRLREQYPREKLYERDGGRQYVISVHARPDGGRLAFVKGAPEQVVELCRNGAALDDAERRAILERSEALASDGLRVLAVAWRTLPADAPEPQAGFRYLGLLALRDPLRPGAADAIAAARRAGIRTILVTGDHRSTATAIARQLGLDGEALDGTEAAALAAADTSEARARLRRIAVLSRVTPADKLALVEALRRDGEVVAMAGDGINDAPALKVADVGVAVGRNASDLTRHVADVVLAGDDLRAILAAVAEGRIVQDNLRRAIRFLFATNLSEMALMIGAALVGARDPLTPLQLLWINMLTDTLPALALALEPGDRSVLDRAPAPPGAPIFSRARAREVGRDGGLLAALGAAGALVGGPPVAFSTLLGAQLAYTLECHAGDRPPTSRFTALVGGTAAVQLAGLTLPPLRALLGLSGAGAGPLLGFAAGFALPWLAGRLSGGIEIVREGTRPDRRACQPAPPP